MNDCIARVAAKTGLGGFRDRLEYMTRRLAILDKLGPNPEGTLKRLMEFRKNQMKRGDLIKKCKFT